MWRILAFLLVLLLNLTVAQAQDEPLWYWARTNEGGLAAFNLEGTVNTLIESGLGENNFRTWRIDNNTALAVVPVGEAFKLYHLTADTVQEIETPYPLDSSGRYATGRGSYVALLSIQKIQEVSGMLVNLEQNVAEPLTGTLSFLGVARPVFSADGVYLRYLGMNAETKVWTLYERKLETGQEREIYTIENDEFPNITSDPTGDHWLYIQRDQEAVINRAILIRSSGVSEIIAEDTRQNITFRRIFGDSFMTYSYLCGADCLVEFTPITGDQPPVQLTMPVMSGSILNPLVRPFDDYLVLQDDRTLWELGPNNHADVIGYWIFENMSSTQNAVSPDGRYILSFASEDDPNTYQIWSTERQEMVLARSDFEEDAHLVQVFYGEGGLIVAEDSRRFTLYRYSDGDTFILPENGGGIYFDVLADGTVLYSQYRPDAALERGVYHYDQETEIFTLLISDAQALYAQPIS